ncbi:Protein N-acetyltransferase, RimJ/RimL family [Aliiroseovarius sediminilitoris]|uniref:Protein N-acetyltransferase, RimJ/RimL family n=1 Tax=Aliiroseovarius sediminilitoris TaxID=1173584 RepID=A0A1I0PNR9_9RHOB|nr:GNAT family N-acetyltransferase [Aliiroseovarius sediminilitoris]SEW16002.1 Protein N-acetyltransferase, RimJ/RimL family [Aliiroseovarius sediminilitoris]
MKHVEITRQPLIEADRFVLRPVRRSDAGMLSMYTADERVASGTRSIPHPLPPGTTEAFIERSLQDERNEDVWVMDAAQNDGREVLGVISLTHLDRAQSQLGYWVAPGFWNTGIASEAVQAIVAANPQHNTSIFAEVFQDNAASARVLTHAGFEYIGDAESHCVARNANVPTWTYINKIS